MSRHLAAFLLALAACTDNSGGGGGGGGGSDVTTHVIGIEFPATPNLYCFEQALADVDPDSAGSQYECSVSEFQDYGQANQVETLLARCNNLEMPDASTNAPCWAIVIDAMNCPAADHLSMRIVRPGAPAANTTVVAQCVAKGA